MGMLRVMDSIINPGGVVGRSLGWGVVRSDGVGKLRDRDSIVDSISNLGGVVGRSLGWGVGRSALVGRLRVKDSIMDSISNPGGVVGRRLGWGVGRSAGPAVGGLSFMDSISISSRVIVGPGLGWGIGRLRDGPKISRTLTKS